MTPRLALMGTALALSACSSAVTPEKISQVKPGMTPDQAQAILGRPASVEQSETEDQTISGEVDHYPASSGDDRVIFVNHTVFKVESVYVTTK